MGTAHEFHGGKKMSGPIHILLARHLVLWRVAGFKLIFWQRMLAT